MPREHAVSRAFIFDTLEMSPYQFYESLDISINIRKNNSVIKVCCEGEVIKQIMKNNGSIGYTSEYFYYNYKNEVKRIKVK